VAKNKPERKLRLHKLSSGNTVLAKSLTNDQGSYLLHKPMEVVVIPNPRNPNQTVITLMEFMPAMAQEEVRIERQHVLCTSNVKEEVAALYKQATDPSPIEEVKKPGLVLPPGA
jgi:hypothetical protein